jgi:hypothetical protein
MNAPTWQAMPCQSCTGAREHQLARSYQAPRARKINILVSYPEDTVNHHGRLVAMFRGEFVYERRTSEADLAMRVWRMAGQ